MWTLRMNIDVCSVGLERSLSTASSSEDYATQESIASSTAVYPSDPKSSLPLWLLWWAVTGSPQSITE